jgi:hypothetical protein
MPREFSREKAPELSFFSFDPVCLLKRIRTDFPKIESKRLYVYVQSQPALACVRSDDKSAVVQVHSVLNHPDTPKEVMAFIFRHELLHLEIPAREVDGKRTSHPPEFWSAERALCPERTIAWNWLYLVLFPCLKFDPKHESAYVKSNWKRLMSADRPTVEQLSEVVNLESKTWRPEEEPIL